MKKEELAGKTIEELTKIIEEQNKNIEGAKSEISKLKEKVSQKTEGGLPVVKYNDENYVFIAPSFSIPGVDETPATNYTAVEAAKNEEVIKYLVESKSGILVKKTTEKGDKKA
jgi:hypothetical protein